MDNVLIIEPHCDDASLSCYMPMIKSQNCHLLTITDSGPVRREEHIRFIGFINKMRSRLNLPPMTFYNLGFKDGYAGIDIPELASRIKVEISRSERSSVFLPEESLHQDHVSTFRCGLIACRGMRTNIYTYEYPEAQSMFYHSDPNTYIEMSSEDVENKITSMNCYTSQLRKGRDAEAIRGLAAVRGLSINSPYAEAFKTIHKIGF